MWLTTGSSDAASVRLGRAVRGRYTCFQCEKSSLQTFSGEGKAIGRVRPSAMSVSTVTFERR